MTKGHVRRFRIHDVEPEEQGEEVELDKRLRIKPVRHLQPTSSFRASAGGGTLTSHLHRAVRPFTETLVYSGFGNLDLRRHFMAAIFRW